jgi:metal-responsive CopG/Arc/MetJ family transcriptional regulator
MWAVLSDGITLVILEPMKTAVSIPDSIFHAAESLAKRLGISRSELFSRALEAYLEAHKHDHVRGALDAIYRDESSRLDETFVRMQWASLPKEDR